MVHRALKVNTTLNCTQKQSKASVAEGATVFSKGMGEGMKWGRERQ